MFKTIGTRLTAIAGCFAGHKVCRRFVRRQDGAAAVEFALVAAPFFALVFAILETAIVFFAGQVLETATADSARLIHTGQAQTANWTAEQFKTEVCKRVLGLFDCAGGLKVYAKVVPTGSFNDAAAAYSPPLNGDGSFKEDELPFTPGKECEVVIVRLMYQWPVYVSLLGFNLAELANGKRMLMATAVFRNEPYNLC